MQIDDAILLARETCKRQRLSLSTEKAYTYWIGQYGQFLKSHALRSDPPTSKMEAFLTRLAVQGVSASTQNQAFNALLFLYRECLKVELGPVDALRARRTERVRDCPSVDEVRRLLSAVKDTHGYPTRLIVHLLYACGLRVTEPLNLRIKDLDLSRSQFVIRQAKADKDRVVSFPPCLRSALERQLVIAKTLAANDRAHGIPIPLPGLLGRKYPRAPFFERWAWLFPSRTTCRDPRTGEVVRWRCHEANVQRAVRQAASSCSLDGISPHLLRHAFATHTLRNGAMVRDVQVVLGHVSLETTMGYVHPEADRVLSPLQTFEPAPES
jgi:site-specific recombinase XerD